MRATPTSLLLLAVSLAGCTGVTVRVLDAGPRELPDAAERPCGRGCERMSWLESGALPAARELHTSATYAGAEGSALFVIGGIESDARGTPETIADAIYRAPIAADGSLGPFEVEAITLPYALGQHAQVQLGSRIYVAGGVRDAPTGIASAHVIVLIELDERAHVASVRECAELPQSAVHATMGVVGDHLYLVGGTRAEPVADVWRAPIEADGCPREVLPAPSLPEPRTMHASVVIDGHVYVVGGVGADDAERSAIVRSEHAANGVMLRWVEVGDMESPPSGASVLRIDGALWLLGGAERAGFASAPVPRVRRARLRSDGALDAWEDVDAPLPAARTFVSQTPMLDGRIYSAGGRITLPSGEAQTIDRVFVGELVEP